MILDNLLLPLHLFMTLLNLGYQLYIMLPTELQFFFEFEYVSGASLNPCNMLLFRLVISLQRLNLRVVTFHLRLKELSLKLSLSQLLLQVRILGYQ